ncbi:MAG: hypothetical protein AAF664_15585, partial [Planctomycetota bacterium]
MATAVLITIPQPVLADGLTPSGRVVRADGRLAGRGEVVQVVGKQGIGRSYRERVGQTDQKTPSSGSTSSGGWLSGIFGSRPLESEDSIPEPAPEVEPPNWEGVPYHRVGGKTAQAKKPTPLGSRPAASAAPKTASVPRTTIKRPTSTPTRVVARPQKTNAGVIPTPPADTTGSQRRQNESPVSVTKDLARRVYSNPSASESRDYSAVEDLIPKVSRRKLPGGVTASDSLVKKSKAPVANKSKSNTTLSNKAESSQTASSGSGVSTRRRSPSPSPTTTLQAKAAPAALQAKPIKQPAATEVAKSNQKPDPPAKSESGKTASVPAVSKPAKVENVEAYAASGGSDKPAPLSPATRSSQPLVGAPQPLPSRRVENTSPSGYPSVARRPTENETQKAPGINQKPTFSPNTEGQFVATEPSRSSVEPSNPSDISQAPRTRMVPLNPSASSPRPLPPRQPGFAQDDFSPIGSGLADGSVQNQTRIPDPYGRRYEPSYTPASPRIASRPTNSAAQQYSSSATRSLSPMRTNGTPAAGPSNGSSNPGMTFAIAPETPAQAFESRNNSRVIRKSDDSPSPMITNGMREQIAAPSMMQSRLSADGATILSSELPGIRVTTRGPSSMMIRQTHEYEIRVENRGRVGAEGLLVRAHIPDWAAVEGNHTSRGQVERDATGNTQQTLVWNLDRLPAGSTETLFVRLKATRSGTHNLDIDWTLVPVKGVAEVKVQEPRLDLVIEGPDQIIYGQSQVYKVRVLNPGDGVANGVVFTLAPDSYAPQSQRIGNIPSGKEAQFEIELTAQDLGELRIDGLATADLDLRSEKIKVIKVAAAELVAEIAGPEVKYQNTKGH